MHLKHKLMLMDGYTPTLVLIQSKTPEHNSGYIYWDELMEIIITIS